MPQQVLNSVENNFTKGLVTEFTGLNFPENAATDTFNCNYTLIGDVIRREGIDYETNFALNALGDRSGKALSDYKWNNAGGDGLTQIIVTQVGSTLYFFLSTSATTNAPLSTTKLSSTVNLVNFVPAFSFLDPSPIECQYSDGNGYLFIYHPYCDPIYCTYNAGVITPNGITIRTRDFQGIPEPGIDANTRPNVLSAEHLYNLENQGWTQGNPYSATSTSNSNIAVGSFVPGNYVFTVAAGLSATNGDSVNLTFTGIMRPQAYSGTIIASGTVTAYAGTSLTINILTIVDPYIALNSGTWTIVPINHGYITTWNTAVGNFPSNADVWWYFKDTTGAFNPTTTINRVTLASGNAPRGHFILKEFIQSRATIAAIAGITDIVTPIRPKTGTWFQGRVWYTGVDAQQPVTGDEPYVTWSENIYFSNIVTSTADFGNCFQTNDPSSQTLFNLLPSDGGVIKIPGAGSIYKLFPLQNAMIVFAANGIWYLTGSTGIGFAANDYTIVKLSAVRSISSTSFVDVQGLPIFWNEEGIYKVEPAKQGTRLLSNPLHVNPLEVNPITVGTILTFYQSIPLQSKKFVKGAYNPLDYVVQWVYRNTNETNVTDRYQYDRILNYNNVNNAFFPHSIATGPGFTFVHGVRYIEGPGGSTSPPSGFKYFSSQLVTGIFKYTFSDEHDSTFVDWFSFDGKGVNFTSFFVTGYKLHGQASRRFQLPYIYVYSRLGQPVAYYIQSLWDYALNTDSGRWSVQQIVNINNPNFGMAFRRHRLRGWGLVLQIRITSVDGQPFDVMGWSLYETANQGV